MYIKASTRRQKVLQKLSDIFIANSLKEEIESYVKASILYQFIIISVFSVAIFLGVTWWFSLFYLSWMLVITMAVFIGLLILGKKTANTHLVFNLYNLSLLLVYMFPIIETGGMKSPILPQLVVVPMLSFLYGSRKIGIIYISLVVAVFLTFLILPEIGIELENKVDDAYETLFAYINHLLLIAFVLAISFATQYQVKFTHVKLNQANKELLVTQRELREKADYSMRAQAILEKALEKEKRSKKQLESAQAQLVHNEKMAFIGQLTAGIAHEINNPVNFIKSGIEALIQDIQDIKDLRALEKEVFDKIDAAKKSGLIQDTNAIIDASLELIQKRKKEIDFTYLMEEVDNLTDSIQNGVERTAEIVNGLRIYSRLDRGEFKETDINENIDATLVLLYNKYKNEIEVHKNYGDLPQVECIAGKISQVFMNLIDNAIQAIDDRGDIWISTSYHEKNDEIEVKIKDSGKGITEPDKHKIFDPFYTTKEVGEGTGLGLAISKGIIDDHKGKIYFESDAEGTIFHIILPVKKRDDGES